MTTGPSIWKKENIAPITKMGIEGTVAVASLAAAITTILVATSVVAGPAFLASIANPVGIIALFVAATYFAAQAYSSYQQMHKNEEITGQATQAVTNAVANAKIADQATQAVTNAVAGKELISQANFNDSVKSSLNDSNVVAAFTAKGFTVNPAKQ